MLKYDKIEVREALTLDNLFQLLDEWGGEPEYTNYGINSRTICHNNPLENASRKLYYYSNSNLFKCYTGGCEDSSFDIFQLAIKVFKIQKNQDLDLNEAVRYIAFKFGIIGTEYEEVPIHSAIDWEILNNYERIQSLVVKDYHINLKEYDSDILDRFNYSVRIAPWLHEGIKQEVLSLARIGYYPGGEQITIPHYDAENRLIGIRGRSLCEEDAERFGKYRPLTVNGATYNHPLGMALYGLNWAKKNISLFGKVVVFESEKSVMHYISDFGLENDIAVACCGSNLSAHQMQLLLDYGAKEIIIAFDRQFQELNDEEHKRWVRNLRKIHERYHNYATISFIFDKKKITGYKDSPIDESKEKFLQLYKERVFLS